MLKKILAGTVLAGFAVFMPASAQNIAEEPTVSTQPESEITEIDVMLKGYVFGLRIAKVNFKTGFNDNEYFAYAMMRTSGLGAFLKKWSIWSLSTGYFDGSDIKPASHLQQNLNKKHRRVEMAYGDDAVDVSIVPPLGSQGVPPASEKERFESDDTLSVLLKLTMGGVKTSEEPCVGTVPVFDSKQHYLLRMERDGEKYIKQKGYKGDTIRCKIYYIPVSGFDPEDLPSEEEVSTPVTIYLAKHEAAGLYIPIKMVYKISGFNAVIKTRDIKISKRPAQNVEFLGLGFNAQEAKLRELKLLYEK